MASAQPPSSSPDSSAAGRRRPSPESSDDFAAAGIADGSMGSLEVYIHQARDIHNICIYHKQDVYAKVCFTGDPDAAVSTGIVNGGGRNPVFNESLTLNIRSVESSLKCEIWMLSRVKNYLGDQLLGFALVPFPEIVAAGTNGKVRGEFSLSSNDLFHSPAGFVELSLSYVGASPEMTTMEVVAPPRPAEEAAAAWNEDSIPSEYEKIEFPDVKVATENRIMVSEYVGIRCDKLESESGAGTLVAPDDGDYPDPDAGHRLLKSFSSSDNYGHAGAAKSDSTPLSTVSANGGSPSPSRSEGSPQQINKMAEAEGESSSPPSGSCAQPMIKIEVEPVERCVVQQEIVDMYMKSMQQFTESLAKMKLPMDVENERVDVEKKSPPSDQKSVTPNGGSRVFYGSRAFF